MLIAERVFTWKASCSNIKLGWQDAHEALTTWARIREALTEPISAIIDAVRVALEQTPAELSADIVDKGIVLAGGGALLKGLDLLLREETGLPVMIADDALTAVALGCGQALDDDTLLKNVARLA